MTTKVLSFCLRLDDWNIFFILPSCVGIYHVDKHLALPDQFLFSPGIFDRGWLQLSPNIFIFRAAIIIDQFWVLFQGTNLHPKTWHTWDVRPRTWDVGLITLTKFKFQSWNLQYTWPWLDNFESDYFPIVYKILNVFKEQLFKLSLTFLNSLSYFKTLSQK